MMHSFISDWILYSQYRSVDLSMSSFRAQIVQDQNRWPHAESLRKFVREYGIPGDVIVMATDIYFGFIDDQLDNFKPHTETLRLGYPSIFMHQGMPIIECHELSRSVCIVPLSAISSDGWLDHEKTSGAKF